MCYLFKENNLNGWVIFSSYIPLSSGALAGGNTVNSEVLAMLPEASGSGLATVHRKTNLSLAFLSPQAAEKEPISRS
ncbi:hypothetical protein [Pontibacter qinzhouensis]|uniref:hypothetical protein n=1 Tax=Pontibacter qinzhouensis TaxID=2603253 RepID=UPI00164FF6C4|nr:hypothetical protein [Pontibacter qinzhouensis]